MHQKHPDHDVFILKAEHHTVKLAIWHDGRIATWSEVQHAWISVPHTECAVPHAAK